MTSQCPRCGAPRMGDLPFCHHCGLDLRYLGAPAMPPQQPLPPQQPIYGAPPSPYGQPPSPYGQPQAPYYYQPQQPQQPVYQQTNQWTVPWQTPQPPAAPPAAPMAPVPAQAPDWSPDTAEAAAGTATSADQPAIDESADTAAADQTSAAAQAPAAQAPAGPSVCLRCYAPLYPGYSHCTNCGFDNNIVYGALAAQAPRGIPTIAYALALLGAGLIAAAAALVLVAAH